MDMPLSVQGAKERLLSQCDQGRWQLMSLFSLEKPGGTATPAGRRQLYVNHISWFHTQTFVTEQKMSPELA